MARTALVALTWVVAASAVRYMDYSGVKMPQYGPGDYDSDHEPPPDAAAIDDYHGHSPDASASLDYKFEEDTHGKSEKPLKESEEGESWSKYARRHKELERLHNDENFEILDKYNSEPEDMSKIKLNGPLPVHRRRQKNKKSRKESPQQLLVKYKRGRSDQPDFDRDYYQGSREESREEGNRKNIKGSYRYNKATERIIHRKQRDRHLSGRLEDDREMKDALEPNRRMRPEHRTEPEYVIHGEEIDRTNDQEPYRPVLDVGDDTEVPSKHKNKAYDHYGDYYDMKRVHNIKSKLPTLLRRTSARVASPTVTSTDVLEALWMNRRTAHTNPATSAPPARGIAALSVVPLPPSSTTSTSLAVTVSTSHITISTLSTLPTSSNVSEEISFAEKSRLSIFKKAQRKESLRSDSSTMKPPVLMQVTDKRLTVVVVEPPSSDGPWMRVREVARDTPERVDRAKRLMRRKLVASAKNIQELTDNWDEMVCDYIDMSLLDSAPPRLHTTRFLIAIDMILTLAT